MDLRRCGHWLLGGALVSLLAGCSSSDAPFEVDDAALELPGTLLEAYVLADKLARDVSDRAYVTELGGGFSIMDEEGRSRNHSFVFHAIEGQGVFRKILVDLIGGTPWTQVANVGPPPREFRDLASIGDSDLAIAAALNWADLTNAEYPDSIPIPDPPLYSARIRSSPNFPERRDLAVGEPQVEITWRVDFLTMQAPAGVPEAPAVPWTIARFYFTPNLPEEPLQGLVQTQSYVDRP